MTLDKNLKLNQDAKKIDGKGLTRHLKLKQRSLIDINDCEQRKFQTNPTKSNICQICKNLHLVFWIS